MTVIVNGSNVAHVQLDGNGNNHITKVLVKCQNNWANGYILIPDSLSTGMYSLKAFTYHQGKVQSQGIFEKKLIVYNRFERELQQIGFIENDPSEINPGTSEIVIITNKSLYKQRDEVLVNIDLSDKINNNISALIISAGLSDPLSEAFVSAYSVIDDYFISSAGATVAENNGILISGRVYSAVNHSTVSDAIVLFSILDSIPYFDYCVSDDNGGFMFFLKNAYGAGNIYLQAVTQNKEKCEIVLFGHTIEERNTRTREDKILTIEQRNYVEKLVDASYYERLFKGYNFKKEDNIDLSVPEIPFYGKPSLTVYPELFIDLPDFTEISRELLHGVIYRNKKDSVSIKVGNFVRNSFFEAEPLMLLDGIPVFDPDIFTPMGTNKIKRIDAVFRERYFGDLVFKGVMAVYSNDSTLSWVDKNKEINKVYFNFLQQDSKAENLKYKNPGEFINTPDYRQVLFNEAILDTNDNHELKFFTSDLKGEVTIQIVGITKDNRLVYANKKIEVK